MDPYSKVELLTLHTGGWHDEEEGLRDDLPSGRVPGRASDPPRSRDDGGGGYRRFRGIFIGYLGFWHRGVFIGEEARQWVPRVLTPPGTANPRPRRQGCGPWCLPSVSYSGSVFPMVKY